MSLDNPICIFCEENVRAWDDDVLNVEIDEPGAPTAPARLHHFVAFCGGRSLKLQKSLNNLESLIKQKSLKKIKDFCFKSP